MPPILKVQSPPSAKASAIFRQFFFIHVFGSKSSKQVER
jgi:hypothetical protein